jgi:hypothetical protein
MTMPSFRPLAAAALLGLLALPLHVLALDDSDLPETLRANYVSPVVGPANSESYAHGKLGIVRPGFGRASLYVAYRLMQLPPGAVASESHRRGGNAFLQRKNKAYVAGANEIDAWLEARKALVVTPPQQRPDFFRTRENLIQGIPGYPNGFKMTSVESNCGADTFDFATRTLRDVVADARLTDADRREWIAGQDAVFARCSWLPGTTPVPPLPAALPGSASPGLKALRDYQHAAALFYSDDFEQSRQEFDAMAATPGHPMRAWAALGAMRSVVRQATLDRDWQAAFDDAYHRRGLRDAALNAALAPARNKHRALAEAAMKDVVARSKVIAAEPAFADVKESALYTVRRATTQLSPATVVAWTMVALDHADWNPYAGSTLDLWTEHYARSLPDRPDDQTLAFLRGKHAFYDWIVSVQACGDAVRPPDETICRVEHAHALARWQETKRNDWLLASLMTARQPTAADLPAADAAQAVARERPEWASVQFYAARVLSAQGRANDARKALDRIAGAPELQVRDDKLVDGERLALGR